MFTPIKRVLSLSLNFSLLSKQAQKWVEQQLASWMHVFLRNLTIPAMLAHPCREHPTDRTKLLWDNEVQGNHLKSMILYLKEEDEVEEKSQCLDLIKAKGPIASKYLLLPLLSKST